MMYLPHRRKHFRASGGGYTELATTTFTPSTASAWTEYDLYTNQGIPKGAVVELLVMNKDSAETEAGARNDGSSLDRKLDIAGDYGAGGTYNTARMIVTCHASTGKFEYYAENTSNIVFQILGYWEGVTFTEKFESITVSAAEDAQWLDQNFNTLYSTPVSSVCDIQIGNVTNGARTIGSRTNGSSLERKLDVGNVYGGGVAIRGWFTKLDSSGILELYLEVYSSNTAYFMGYFDSSVDYEERFDDITPSADTTWTDKDLSSYVSSPLQAEIFLGIGSYGGNVGARKNGSALSRLVDQGSAHSVVQPSGTPITCNLDAANTIEVYSAAYANSSFYHVGYFK